jgi:hypothetical protein
MHKAAPILIALILSLSLCHAASSSKEYSIPSASLHYKINSDGTVDAVQQVPTGSQKAHLPSFTSACLLT